MTAWYVIHSKSQQEEFLFRQLCSRDIRAYYPCIHVHPVNPRAHKTKPFFPGYLFLQVNLDEEGISKLQWLPGAIGLVSIGGEPAKIPDNLISAIQKRVDLLNHTNQKVDDGFQAGDHVSVIDGPLAGYQVVFDSQVPGSERVRVLLNLIQDRLVCVDLPRWQLGKTKQH